MPFLYELHFEGYPTLDLQSRAGSSDYIDFITPEEMSSSVMVGKDYCNRKFVCIRGLLGTTPFCQTFFQRYTDIRDFWMGAGHHGLFMETSGGMETSQHEFICKLLNNRTVTLTSDSAKCLRIRDARDMIISLD